MNWWSIALPLWLTTALTSGIAAYFGAYLKRKGENRAVAEELDELIRQVKAITQATKTIENAISDQVWNRQRLWELKRDALLAATFHLSVADQSTIHAITAWFLRKTRDAMIDTTTQDRRKKAVEEWLSVMNEFDQKRSALSIVCEARTARAFSDAGKAMRQGMSLSQKWEITGYPDVAHQIQREIALANKLARLELGVEQISGDSIRS